MRRGRAGQPNLFNDEQRAYIVTQFALGMGPTQVAGKVKEQFGLTVERNQVNRYNPMSSDGRDLAAKWKQLYAEVREKVVDDISTIEIANRNFRLRQLQEFFYTARERGNIAQAQSLLDQAAKEAGGLMTNERKVTHTGSVSIEDVSDDEKVAYLADKLREQWEKSHGDAGSAGTKH